MNNPPKTRVNLILRLQRAEDAAAWQEFVEIYQPLVYRLARTKGLQEADANDLTQEVLTRVARSVGKWDPDPSRGTFRGWLSRITRNLVIEFLRNQQRLPKTTLDSDTQRLFEQPSEPSAESNLFDLEYERQVFNWAAEKVKSSFDSKTWKAFWMTSVENTPIAQAAEQLDLSRGAIYIARCRVMARMRKAVQRINDEDDSQIIKQAEFHDS